MKQSIFFLLFFLLLIPALIGAAPTAGCHCFRERTFDPANKYGADDYLLATTYNALISASFNISKQQIVMKKMKGGINADDLLIGLHVSTKTSTPLDLLLSIRDNGGSWKKIIEAPGLAAKDTTDPILAAIIAGKEMDTITRMITDSMLCSYYTCSQPTLESVRRYSLSDKETSLLFALNKQAGASVEKLATMYQQQKMSWSEIAHQFKLTPAEVGKNVQGD